MSDKLNNSITNHNLDNIGILDIEGVNNNPFTNLPYSEEYKTLSKTWSKFPAYKIAKQAIDDIKNHQVVLVVSGTGSGKTVLFPKYVSHALNYQGKVAVTLPKQIIAKSAADFAAKTLDVKIGDHVGYQFRGESKRNSQTKLLYATDGTIVARLLNDPELRDFDAVVVDEAHERKIQIDFLLYLLKKTLTLRPNFKLIIMSATINAEIFKSYFDEFNFKQVDISSGTHYPIESVFLDKPISQRDYLDKGLEIINKILKEDPKDTLFFVTSVNETINTCNKMNGEVLFKEKNSMCVEVYSGIDSKKQELAQDKQLYKDQGYNVKIVASTNVAESSLTIDGIKYVIDSGFELKSYFDPKTRANRLDKGRITKAQAKQRMGRAGRTAPGLCYHLYTQQEFEDMEEFPQPSIRISDITDESLKLLKNAGSTKELISMYSNFIEPPREEYLYYSLKRLKEAKLIKESLTELGNLIIDKFSSFSYQQGIALLCGVYFKCHQELLSIFAIQEVCKNSIESLFNDGKKVMEILKLTDNKLPKLVKEHEQFIKKFKSASGDHISLLNIYQTYRKKIKNKEKVDIFYSVKILSKAMKRREKMSRGFNLRREDLEDKKHLFTDVLKLKNIDNINRADLKNKILLCLVVGFRQNFATKIKGKSLYSVDGSCVDFKLSKDSYLYNKEPGSIIFDELFINSGKSEIKIASLINSEVKKLLS